eukprot:875542-Rhodomonas_salina.1
MMLNNYDDEKQHNKGIATSVGNETNNSNNTNKHKQTKRTSMLAWGRADSVDVEVDEDGAFRDVEQVECSRRNPQKLRQLRLTMMRMQNVMLDRRRRRRLPWNEEIGTSIDVREVHRCQTRQGHRDEIRWEVGT